MNSHYNKCDLNNSYEKSDRASEALAEGTQRYSTKNAPSANCSLPVVYPRPASTLKWYVVQTKPRQEDRAQYFLAEKGFETYLPKMEVDNSRSYRGMLIQKPLFPCYLFTRFDVQQNLAHVRWTKGVVKILPESNRPQSLDNDIIKGIRKLCSKDGVVRKRSLKPREKIRIAKGPLKNLLGIFQHWSSDQGRVRILLNLVNYQATVELHHSKIEKIG